MLTIISAAAMFAREKAARYRVSEEPVRRCAGVPAVRISFAHDGSSNA
jgi:hypothetical protein